MSFFNNALRSEMNVIRAEYDERLKCDVMMMSGSLKSTFLLHYGFKAVFLYCLKLLRNISHNLFSHFKGHNYIRKQINANEKIINITRNYHDHEG